MITLRDKIIVVTGGEGLLGKAFCSHIREAGGIAISADITCEDNLNEGSIRMDISDEPAVRSSIAAVCKHYGRIDGLINNAYPRTADWRLPCEEVPIESWRQNIDTHLTGYFICARAALESMKTRGSGCVINIGSIYGVAGPDFRVYEGAEDITNPVAYSAIKGGIINLTRYLAAYYGPHGLRVNAISPGGVQDAQPEVFIRNYCARVPLKRMAKPSDVAPAAVYLLSDSASYVTGHNLMVDGGWSAV